MASMFSAEETADQNTEDIALNFGEDTASKKTFKHPIAAACHLLFRTLALIVYLICELFSSSFISSFVVIVLLLSFDFWVVKNVTGRLLVGLRWWNYVDDDGVSHWIFESRKGKEKTTQASEVRLFWLGLLVCPILWIFFFVAALFSLKIKWMLVVAVGLSLNIANLIGYVKCKKDAGKQIGSMATTFFGKQIFNQMMKPTPPPNSK